MVSSASVAVMLPNSASRVLLRTALNGEMGGSSGLIGESPLMAFRTTWLLANDSALLLPGSSNAPHELPPPQPILFMVIPVGVLLLVLSCVASIELLAHQPCAATAATTGSGTHLLGFWLWG